jgi:hypothetical protein
MAEQVRQEQGRETPWAVKLTTADSAAFLDGTGQGAVSSNGLIDTTTTGAKAHKVALAIQRDGVVVRWEALKSTGGKTPVAQQRCRLFPWSKVVWVDMGVDAQSSQQNSGK